MFSISGRVNHRLWLSLVSASAAGLILAVLFAAVVMGYRSASYRGMVVEVTEAIRTFTIDPDEIFRQEEFHTAFPDLTARVVKPVDVEVPTDGKPRLEKGRIIAARPFKHGVLQISASWSRRERDIQMLAILLAALWPLLTLLVGLSTWFAARGVFGQLFRLTDQAAAFAGSTLSERLHSEDRHEFGEFASALNGMLDRIEREVGRSDRFAADAAHELRTPLAILRTRIDTALLKTRSPEEYQETLRQARNQLIQLTDIAQALLRTARGGAVEAVSQDLKPIVQEVGNMWKSRFDSSEVRLRLKIESAQAVISSEEVNVILNNLLDNALRFAPRRSTVELTLANRDVVVISVADQGPGIAPELGDRAFDRLVRGDDDRNRSSGGAGLGLALVRRIAQSRRGRAHYRETPGGGATVIVELPLPGAVDASLDSSVQ